MEPDREREGKEEKADMYCGRVCHGWRKTNQEGRKREECGGAPIVPGRGRSVRECLQNEETVSSKKPVAAGAERADPVAPPLWVNNHRKPWLGLMNPLPMS